MDAAPEMLSINRERLQTGNVEYCKADIFSWTPPTGFDLVFVSFWLSGCPTFQRGDSTSFGATYGAL